MSQLFYKTFYDSTDDQNSLHNPSLGLLFFY